MFTLFVWESFSHYRQATISPISRRCSKTSWIIARRRLRALSVKWSNHTKHYPLQLLLLWYLEKCNDLIFLSICGRRLLSVAQSCRRINKSAWTVCKCSLGQNDLKNQSVATIDEDWWVLCRFVNGRHQTTHSGSLNGAFGKVWKVCAVNVRIGCVVMSWLYMRCAFWKSL